MNQSIRFAPSQSQAPRGFGAGNLVSQALGGHSLPRGLPCWSIVTSAQESPARRREKEVTVTRVAVVLAAIAAAGIALVTFGLQSSEAKKLIVIPPNSVGSKQVIDHSLRARDLARG